MGKSGGSALGFAVGGPIGGMVGSNFDQAGAINDAGQAMLNQQMQDRSQALGFAAPSDQEMQQLQQSITLNNQDIARKQAILASTDPAIIEAGKQATQLMQGKAAAALAPLQNQRAQQRQQLQQTLASQLGPDYATSTAGIQALNNFDQQTSNITTQAQQQTLSQFLGVAQSGEQFGNLQGNIGDSSALATQRGQIGMRQAGVISQNRIDPSLGYAGQIAQNAALGKTFGTMTSLGMQGLSMGAGGGGGNAAGSFGSLFGGSGGGYGGSLGAPNSSLPGSAGSSYSGYGNVA